MCGIAGLIGPDPVPQERQARALAIMAERGPDNAGSFSGRLRTANLTLLHTRLSILDLDHRADQPFTRNGLTLIYNGEVYNYLELRAELEAVGVTFTTSGDTEVVLEAYRRWGVGAFRRMEGMWALALHDANSGEMVLCRDRFGEKPLYTYRHGRVFTFGSDTKVLFALANHHAEVNVDHLSRYLVNGYKGLYRSGHTFYQGVAEFPAGHYAVVTDAGSMEPRRYWSLEFDPDESLSPSAVLEQVDELVENAIRLRLRADVPVAVRLSGGIDSNVIAGMALRRLQEPVKTYSIVDHDPRYDERTNIMAAIGDLQCDHRIIEIPRTGFIDRLKNLTQYCDGPCMSISYYMHALVSEAMHEDGIRVSLGGVAADEIFTGYYDHYLFWLATQTGDSGFDGLVDDWRATYGQFVRNPYLQDPYAFIKNPDDRRHIFLGADKFAGFLCDGFDEPHGETPFCDDILRNRMMNELTVETVPVMLHDDDLTSMMHSVENRSPYLDSKLAEFLFRVPTSMLVQNGLPKYLLRKIGRDVALPSIMNNPRKQGINAPVGHFVDFEDAAVRDWLLQPSPFFDLVRRDKFKELIENGASLNSESKFLFSCMSAKIFLENQSAPAAVEHV